MQIIIQTLLNENLYLDKKLIIYKNESTGIISKSIETSDSL